MHCKVCNEALEELNIPRFEALYSGDWISFRLWFLSPNLSKTQIFPNPGNTRLHTFNHWYIVYLISVFRALIKLTEEKQT